MEYTLNLINSELVCDFSFENTYNCTYTNYDQEQDLEIKIVKKFRGSLVPTKITVNV